MGIGTNGSSNPSDVAYNGTDQPLITSGAVQCGGWASPVGRFFTAEILQSVPAQVTVGISGTGVQSVSNSPSQFKVQKSLANGTFTLVGHVMTANGANTDAAKGTFVWQSRNSHVATVDQTGVVTPQGRGQCVLECRYSRQANSSYVGATPSPTEMTAAYASVITTIIA